VAGKYSFVCGTFLQIMLHTTAMNKAVCQQDKLMPTCIASKVLQQHLTQHQTSYPQNCSFQQRVCKLSWYQLLASSNTQQALPPGLLGDPKTSTFLEVCFFLLLLLCCAVPGPCCCCCQVTVSWAAARP
jgi:hypothetical protein